MKMDYVISVSIIGLLLSLYALYVERKSEKEGYKAVCDINDRMSCTKAFKSSYGKMFKISNSVMGIIFYILIIVLSFMGFKNYVFYLAIASTLASFYLWYVLTFKVKTICVVCYSIYIVNILLLVLSYNTLP